MAALLYIQYASCYNDCLVYLYIGLSGYQGSELEIAGLAVGGWSGQNDGLLEFKAIALDCRQTTWPVRHQAVQMYVMAALW